MGLATTGTPIHAKPLCYPNAPVFSSPKPIFPRIVANSNPVGECDYFTFIVININEWY